MPPYLMKVPSTFNGCEGEDDSPFPTCAFQFEASPPHLGNELPALTSSFIAMTDLGSRGFRCAHRD